MKKVFYAVNQKEYEAQITEGLKGFAEVAGLATYRESVLEKLPESGADILILRETLAGHIKIADLLKQIRSSTDIRIVLITKYRPAGDRFLQYVISLGIYDILNADVVPPNAVIDKIKHPGTFSSVTRFMQGADFTEEQRNEESPAEEKKGGLFGRLKKTVPKEAPKEDETGTLTKGQVDIEILRKSIHEEAQRKAQEDLDSIVRKAAADKTKELSNKVSSLNEAIRDKDLKISSYEKTIANLKSDVSALKMEKSRLSEEFLSLKESMGNSLRIYEERIDALSKDTVTPAVFREKEEAWEKERAAYEEKIAEFRRLSEDSSGDDTKLLFRIDQQKAELKRLNQKIAELNKALYSAGEENKELNKKLAESSSRDQAEFKEKAELKKKIKEQKESYEKEIADLKEKALNAGSVRTELLKAEDEAAGLREALSEVKLQLLSAENDLKSKREELEAARQISSSKGIDEQRTLNEGLKRKLEEKDQKIAELNLKLLTFEKDDSVKALRSKNKELTRKLEQYIEAEPEEVKAEDFIYSGMSKVVVMTSSRRGIGNTTTAINLAGVLAERGEKTILVEFDAGYPFLQSFFKFKAPEMGLEEASGALRERDLMKADSCILKLPSARASLHQKIQYKKLPSGLHLMQSSRSTQSKGTLSFSDGDITLLINYLSQVQHYSNVIFDIHIDDPHIWLFLKEHLVNRFVLTLWQSERDMRNAKAFLSKIIRKDLISSGAYIFDSYNESLTDPKTIAKQAGFPKDRILLLSKDLSGISASEEKSLPYYLGGDEGYKGLFLAI